MVTCFATVIYVELRVYIRIYIYSYAYIYTYYIYIWKEPISLLFGFPNRLFL